MYQDILTFGAGAAAGILNAAAGGGSFLTLPTLLAIGVPPVAANASSTVALLPGSMSSALAYRDDLVAPPAVSLRALLAVSVVGGVTGAQLLLHTSDAAFGRAVPWLLLAGTIAFAVGREVGVALQRIVRVNAATLLAAQFALGIYGGYFGGAVGVLMLAVWNVAWRADLSAMNALKAVLVGAANAGAVACFLVAGTVVWRPTLVMLVGAVIGGYVGAFVARRLPQRPLRMGIIAMNVAVTVAVFVRTYRGS